MEEEGKKGGERDSRHGIRRQSIEKRKRGKRRQRGRGWKEGGRGD